MSNNFFDDKKGEYEVPIVTLESIDRVVKGYFNDKLNISVETESGRKKAAVIFASGERWKMRKRRR
jgi:alkyl hydroperoxide reductase subunit AhpF